MDGNTKFYTPKEAAVHLRVSLTTMYRWLGEGKVPGAVQPIGKKWLIPAKGLWRVLGEVSKA